MKKIIRLTESDLTRIVKRVISESNRVYLIETADVTKKIQTSLNTILTTLRTINEVPGDPTKKITFSNLELGTSTSPNRKIYNIIVTVSGPRPETFTINVGNYLDVVNTNWVNDTVWKNYLIRDFETGVNNVNSKSPTWSTIKNTIKSKLKSIQLPLPK
jgi:hypothetical protein